MATFNGHKNWNHWNVSLWLATDEGLCALVSRSLLMARTKAHAVWLIQERLADAGITHTPDGAPFTSTAIRAALVGWTD